MVPFVRLLLAGVGGCCLRLSLLCVWRVGGNQKKRKMVLTLVYVYDNIRGPPIETSQLPAPFFFTVMGLPGARARVGHLRVVAVMAYLLVLIAVVLAEETATAGMLVARTPKKSRERVAASRSSAQCQNQNQRSSAAANVRGSCCSCDFVAGVAR